MLYRVSPCLPLVKQWGEDRPIAKGWYNEGKGEQTTPLTDKISS